MARCRSICLTTFLLLVLVVVISFVGRREEGSPPYMENINNGNRGVDPKILVERWGDAAWAREGEPGRRDRCGVRKGGRVRERVWSIRLGACKGERVPCEG
uniref:Uncharacterized protein n=1 Tax=Oryza sativa subsp. japonica TaxID=39947 RepID=Q10G49_ORYSJ|nr:hypothetical protein LOC_Os03g44220 [Oryza sativa Japonica Group]